MRKYLTLLMFILCFISSGCSFIVDPMTQAQNLIRNSEFEKAIGILEKEYKNKPESVPLKSVLARAYTHYGFALCQDESLLPRVKYPMAKEQLAMALALDPYLKEAKEMYGIIEKIQLSFKENKLDQ